MKIKIYIAPSINYKKLCNKKSEEYICRKIGEKVEQILNKIPEFDVVRNKYRCDYAGDISKASNLYISKEDLGYYISIHTNLAKEQGIGGYCKGKTIEENSSYRLSKNIQDEIIKLYQRKDKIHKIENGDRLSAELSLVIAKACIVEIGNIENTYDAKFMENNIEEISRAIVNGVISSSNKDYNLNIEYQSNRKNKFKILSRNSIKEEKDEVFSKVENMESRIHDIEEKLQGLAEYIKIKEIDIDKINKK